MSRLHPHVSPNLNPNFPHPNPNSNAGPYSNQGNAPPNFSLPPNVLQLSRPLYAPLEYKLRVALKSVSATVVRAFAVKTQQQTEAWMRGVGDRAIVEAWIDVSQLSGENSIHRIVERGFQVPEYGVRISCGSIHLEPVDEPEIRLGGQLQDSPKRPWKPKKVYKLLHVWACIGRPFVTEATEGEIVIPHGYDSVYLQSNQDMGSSSRNVGSDGLAGSGAEYHHKYIIYDCSKLFTDYLVYLEYSPDGDAMLRTSMGEVRDGLDLHGNIGSPGISTFGLSSLRTHINNDIIEEAYKKILNTLQIKEEELEHDTMPVLMETDDQLQRIDYAKDILSSIEHQRAQVCENAVEVESELRDQFKKALLELHDITQLKLSKLCSYEVEITRRIQEMQWMNEFIQYQRPILDPLSFVESYSHHSIIKESKIQELAVPLSQAEETIQSARPDISCVGKLDVSSETELITDQMLKRKQVVLINPPQNKHEGIDSPNKDGSFDDQALNRGDCVIS